MSQSRFQTPPFFPNEKLPSLSSFERNGGGDLHLDSKLHNLFGDIERCERDLYAHLQHAFTSDTSLTRTLVSFQANKRRSKYRWYKYKEAFSAALVERLIRSHAVNGRILDPFAGSGTTLFAASDLGVESDGIELLPIGSELIETRKALITALTEAEHARLAVWMDERPWIHARRTWILPELRITRGAYPGETRSAIERYMSHLSVESPNVQKTLRMACLCVLEEVSYTRKDGQYLRWDYRAGRRLTSNPFDKGQIPSFDEAVTKKLREIIDDAHGEEGISLFPELLGLRGSISLYEASCLDALPSLPDNLYEAIITSPPYCNRYDYTRTYALELALLGVDEKELVRLRQAMLSCTVENRAKDLERMHPEWKTALAAADGVELLQAILHYLSESKTRKKLNNEGIPRMVCGYFYEMACVIQECARLLKPHAPLIMVNDNVRYAGAHIAVDLILSRLAERLGFIAESVLVLPTGKGNSSQQMGKHGRMELRKCVYVWRRTA